MFPVLEFCQIDGDLKYWFPSRSEFENMHTDEDIVHENKFQYFIKANYHRIYRAKCVGSLPQMQLTMPKDVECLGTFT